MARDLGKEEVGGWRRGPTDPLAFPDRHKLLKWWAQSFLPGVPNVVAGFRNPEGFVCSLKTFPTMEMFEYVRNDRDGWNPSVCMNFCAAFLSFAQNTVVHDDPR